MITYYYNFSHRILPQQTLKTMWFVTMHCFKLWFLMVFNHASWSGHGFIKCLATDLLLCPLQKKLIICEMSLVFFAKQIICNLVLSRIVIEQFNLSTHAKNLFDKPGS